MSFFDTTPRDRYVATCPRCALRFMLDGPKPMDALATFDHSFCLGKGNLRLMRVVWHKRRRTRDTCRRGELLPSPRLPEPKPGECSWMCRGSKSPLCVCEGCHGKEHGAIHVINPLAPAEGAEALYKMIERARPRGDWRARKST